MGRLKRIKSDLNKSIDQKLKLNNSKFNSFVIYNIDEFLDKFGEITIEREISLQNLFQKKVVFLFIFDNNSFFSDIEENTTVKIFNQKFSFKF